MSVSSSVEKAGWLKNVLVALGVALAIVVVFGAGFFVGRQSAFPFRGFPNSAREENHSGHGAIGAIVSIDGQKIIIQMRDGKTQVILVNEDTRLEKKFQKALLTDFKVNDQVVAIGSPNAGGEIQARLVGVVDPSFRPARSSPNLNDPK